MANGRRTAVAGIIGAAVLAACLLVPGMRVGADQPWLGATIIIVPTAALLTVTGYRRYGLGRAIAVALAVTLLAGGVSWLVALFNVGEGIERRRCGTCLGNSALRHADDLRARPGGARVAHPPAAVRD